MKQPLYIVLIFFMISQSLGAKTTALLQAALASDIQQVKAILQQDPSALHAVTPLGETALHLASDAHIIHELIIAGADLNKTNKKTYHTALSQALADNNTDKAMLLILSGAKVNTMDRNGMTPIKWAILYNDYQLVMHLIRSGAKIHPSLIAYARTLNHSDISSLLSLYKTIKNNKHRYIKYDKKGLNALHHAVLRDNAIEIDALLLVGISINTQTTQGKTGLHLAVEYNKETMVTKLLSQHAKISIPDNNGQTPLHIAAQKGLSFITRHLVSQGATKSMPDNKGNTPKNLARAQNHIQLSMLL
jgi:ankyrin repeat protein